MPKKPYIFLDDQLADTTRLYQDPVEVVTVTRPDDIEPAFQRLRDYHQKGLYLAGLVSYEMGYVLNDKLSHLLPKSRNVPFLQIGVFKNYSSSFEKDVKITPHSKTAFPSLALNEYETRFHKVLDYIKAGDVYQINLTFPMTGSFNGSAWDLYNALKRQQPSRYGAVVSLSETEFISLSPELFFKTNGDHIETHPMKGTARRQADPIQDEALRQAMRHDAKSQAENLMIVDLLRNDLSRIAQKGSVKVPELFKLETYPTLHQMTSRVSAKLRSDVDFIDIFKNLFPCGSITGAPKIRAMEIIHELEDNPRGAYCGAIGYVDPGGDSCFNVAIRTATLKKGNLTYNVGSGVVIDSQAKDEYEECLLKARILSSGAPKLIETFRWLPSEGGLRLKRHLARMKRSAKALNYPCKTQTIVNQVSTISSIIPLKIRVQLSADGDIAIETYPFEPTIDQWQVSLSHNALTSDRQETRYKVSDRNFYDGERRRLQALTSCDEILFLNEAGELCEGSFTSLFIEKNGRLYTPALSSGLLPGILREEMIDTGQAEEETLNLDDLKNADKVYVGNSLRGLIEVTLKSYDRL